MEWAPTEEVLEEFPIKPHAQLDFGTTERVAGVTPISTGRVAVVQFSVVVAASLVTMTTDALVGKRMLV